MVSNLSPDFQWSSTGLSEFNILKFNFNLQGM